MGSDVEKVEAEDRMKKVQTELRHVYAQLAEKSRAYERATDSWLAKFAASKFSGVIFLLFCVVLMAAGAYVGKTL